MFFGILVHGFVKVEVSDDVLTPSPTEARGLGLEALQKILRLLDLNRIFAQIGRCCINQV